MPLPLLYAVFGLAATTVGAYFVGRKKAEDVAESVSQTLAPATSINLPLLVLAGLGAYCLFRTLGGSKV